jgi:hypothetical protein
MPLGLLPLYVLLVLAATAVEPAAARRIAFIGLVAFALGLAAYAVNPGSDDLAAIGLVAASSTDAFFWVNTGLLLLGIVVCTMAALNAIRYGPPAAPGRALALLGIGGFVLWTLAPLIARSGGWRPALAAAAVAVPATAGGVAIDRLGPAKRLPELPGIVWPGASSRSLALAAGFGLGALGAAVAPHVGIVFVGLALAALTDFLDRRRRGLARVPWLPCVALVLAPTWWLMARIAGPVGLSLPTLPDIPFSPAAERLVALALGGVAWACLGLWPLHRLFPDGLLAPLGIALWLRVASPAVPGGLEHWQPLFVAAGVLGLCGAAVTGRAAAACNALAFVALAAVAPTSAPAALILGATGLALRITPGESRGAAQRLAWMLAALALPFAFEAGFRGQVIYTLIAGAGTALAGWTSIERVGQGSS